MLLKPLDKRDVLLRQHHVHAVQIVVHRARGVRVVHALYQRVEFVLSRAAQDLLAVEIVADVVKVVVPFERDVAHRVYGHLVLRVGLLRRGLRTLAAGGSCFLLAVGCFLAVLLSVLTALLLVR